MPTSSSPRPNGPAQYVAVVARHKIVVAAFGVFGLVLALLHATVVADRQYESHARVLVRPVFDGPAVPGGGIDRMVLMGTERELATSAAAAAFIRERLQSREPLATVQRRLSARVVGATHLLDIACRSATKDAARRCAGAAAEAYLELRTGQATRSRDAQIANANAALAPLNAQIVEVTKRLAASPVESAPAAEARATLRRLNDEAKPYREILADMAALDVNAAGSVVSGASQPEAPAGRTPQTNGVLGAFVGLSSGLLLAFGRDKIDSRLRGRVELEQYLQAPVLATLPSVQRNARTAPTLVTLDDPASSASEAYRALRTRLLVMARNRGVKTIMVTSAGGEEAKTSTAANLAVSLAQVGQRVALVSADLRGSKLHQYFGFDNQRGLSSVLSGDVQPRDAVRSPAGLERLSVFGAGPTTSEAGELLQSGRLRDLIEERRNASDFVIIEAPAASGPSDCLALASLVDGILVVADVRSTDRHEVAHLRTQFAQVGAHVVGAVMQQR